MTVITPPNELFSVEQRSFRLASRNLLSRALFTDEASPYGPLVQRWQAKLTFSEMEEGQWREWDGIVAQLGGIANALRVWDPARRQPYYNSVAALTIAKWDDNTGWDDGSGWLDGPLPPYVAVDAAADAGDQTVVLRNFPASLSGILARGDLVEFRPGGVPAETGMLHVITGGASSDASGKSRIYFRPGLRSGLAAGDMAVLTDPTTVFCLASDDEGEIDVSGPMSGRLGLSLVERLPRE